MKKYTITILLFLIVFSKTYSQEEVFSPKDLDYIQSIFKRLDTLNNNTDITLEDIYFISVNNINEGNRKRNPEMWEKRLIEKVKISLRIIDKINTVSNVDIDKIKLEPPTKVELPICFKEATKTNRNIKIEEIEDNICKQQYKFAYDNYQRSRNDYNSNLKLLKMYSYVIKDLVLLFEHSSYTSVKELNKYVDLAKKEVLAIESRRLYFDNTLNREIKQRSNFEVNPKH